MFGPTSPSLLNTRDESKTKAPKPQKAKAPRVSPLPDPNTTEFALAA